jgi:hypothetical protein
MSRLFLLRLSFLSIKQLVNSKVNIIINLSIFVIVFALSASFISILFENRIEKLETKITRNEVNQILYTKWLNRTPKIINQIDNVYRNRKDEILFQLMITALPDDDNDNYSTIISNREQYHNYYYFLADFVKINFKNMDLALIDALLLSSSDEDILLVEEQKLIFFKLISKYDKNRFSRIKYEDNKDTETWTKTQDYYKGFDKFNKINSEIVEEQKIFFLNFGSQFFSKKKKFYNDQNYSNLEEINAFAKLETMFILVAFVIQFLIFIILQIFEVTVEGERRNEKS